MKLRAQEKDIIDWGKLFCPDEITYFFSINNMVKSSSISEKGKQLVREELWKKLNIDKIKEIAKEELKKIE